MSNYELIFVVDGIAEELELRLLDEGINLLTTGRLQRAFVEARGSSVLEAVADGVDQLERLGVRPTRLHLDLVTKSEIAERCNVSKTTIDRWAKKINGDCFPREHDWGVTGPVWAWGDVNEWLRRNREPQFDGFCTLNQEQVEEANEWLRQHRQGAVAAARSTGTWKAAPIGRLRTRATGSQHRIVSK